ncbi:MAG: hypothetical protein ACYDHP_10690 [Ferrimicrobium sp.]
MPNIVPVSDAGLDGLRNPRIVAGVSQLSAEHRVFDYQGDPRWLLEAKMIVPYEASGGALVPVVSGHHNQIALFTDSEALTAWLDTPPGMPAPDAVLGPVVTHAAIVDVEAELSELRKVCGALERIVVNPMGPSGFDFNLDWLTGVSSPLQQPSVQHRQGILGKFLGNARDSKNSILTDIAPNFLSDYLVEPSGRSQVRAEIRSRLEEVQQLGEQKEYKKAVEACLATGRMTSEIVGPVIGGVAASLAAYWLREDGDNRAAAHWAKVGWSGLGVAVNFTWLYKSLALVVDLALGLGRENQDIFVHDDFIRMDIDLYLLVETVRARSNSVEAEDLARQLEATKLRIQRELISSKG